MFQSLFLGVNKFLREKAENLKELTASVPRNSLYSEHESVDFIQSLVTNGSTTQTLNELWKRYGNFSTKGTFYLLKEIREDFDFLDGRCSNNDTECMSLVQKVIRSLHALTYVANVSPRPSGLDLAYHMNRIFEPKSYFMKELSDWWPRDLFKNKPDNLELEFNDYLTNFSNKLSNGTLKDISILDMPGIGNMFDSFQGFRIRTLG